MLDSHDIDAPNIFGDLGRDTMKVVGSLTLLPVRGDPAATPGETTSW